MSDPYFINQSLTKSPHMTNLVKNSHKITIKNIILSPVFIASSRVAHLPHAWKRTKGKVASEGAEKLRLGVDTGASVTSQRAFFRAACVSNKQQAFLISVEFTDSYRDTEYFMKQWWSQFSVTSGLLKNSFKKIYDCLLPFWISNQKDKRRRSSKMTNCDNLVNYDF